MKYRVTTSCQVEREFRVEADTPEQAHARMKAYLSDPELLKEGLVELSGAKDTTAPKIGVQGIKPVSAPRPRSADAVSRQPAKDQAGAAAGEAEPAASV